MKKFKFKVNHRKSGKLLKYVTVEGTDIENAYRNLEEKLGIPRSVRDTIHSPVVISVRDPDGKYRAT